MTTIHLWDLHPDHASEALCREWRGDPLTTTKILSQVTCAKCIDTMGAGGPITTSPPASGPPHATPAARRLAEARPELEAALLEAQRAVKRLAVDSRSGDGSFDYTSADAVLDEARAALLGVGLSLRVWWEGVEETPRPVYFATYRLLHVASGQSESHDREWPIVVGPGFPLDKAALATSTSCFAYFLRGLLMLPRGASVEARDDQQRPASTNERRRNDQQRRPERPRPAVDERPPAERHPDRARVLAALKTHLQALGADVFERVVGCTRKQLRDGAYPELRAALDKLDAHAKATPAAAAEAAPATPAAAAEAAPPQAGHEPFAEYAARRADEITAAKAAPGGA